MKGSIGIGKTSPEEWLHRFGGRRDVVGQTVDLDNASYTIIGVLPRTFTFAPSGNAEFWTPLNSFSTHEKMRTFYDFWGIGRLRDGVSVLGAAAEMGAIAKQLQLQYGITGRTLSASIVPLYEVIVEDVRPILLTLLGGAGLLLLIACVNVVRSENRRREIAVRGALGATPARLVRQFMTEGLLLAGFGSLTCVLVARRAEETFCAPRAQGYGGEHAFSERCCFECSHRCSYRRNCTDGRAAARRHADVTAFVPEGA